MTIVLNILLFCFILGLLVTVHEFGHFIFAKKAGIYVYEFSIGMGPKLFGFKRKNDETAYSIRLLPIGGYVHIAGEDVEEDSEVPEDKRLNNKTFTQRFLVMIAGAMNNFILAIILLLVSGFIFGTPSTKPIINELVKGYPAYGVLEKGDQILEINGKKTSTWDDVLLDLQLIKSNEDVKIKVKDNQGDVKTFTLKPKEIEVDGQKYYKLGIANTQENERGFISTLKYTAIKFYSSIKTMFRVLGNLFVGNIGLNSMSGPVGIYNVVGEQAQYGISKIIDLIILLSINVGFINLIPFPAFDGGKVLFLIIEKIRRKPVSPRVENTIHNIGFVLLMGLMLIITVNDIFRIF